MKKVVLLLSVVALTTSSVFAQKVNVDALKSKIEKSDESIANPKKNTKASTWFSRGETFSSVATANCNSIFPGMMEMMLLEAVGKPLNVDSVPVEVIGGEELKIFEYPTVDIYLTNAASGTVKLWVEKSTVDADAVDKAVEAFIKAYELDNSLLTKVDQGITGISTYLTVDAQNLYEMGNFGEAYKRFKKASEIGYKNPKGVSETAGSLLYYAAVASAQAGENEASAEIILDLIEKGIEQEGNVYLYAGLVFERLDRKDDAQKYMEMGVKKYLDNQSLLQQFITFSIQNDAGIDAILPYIKEAQAKDPKNFVFFLSEGIVYNQVKDYDNAIAAYEKAAELNPENWGTFYNLGFAYREKAIMINKELTTVDYTNTKLIDELTEKFYESMTASIAPFEKAYALDTTNKQVVEVLKSIFFTLRDRGADMMEGYTKYDEIFKTM
ncbi:MAG: tetratricopeptide repeat protein [Rikenellaceae bacterium]